MQISKYVASLGFKIDRKEIQKVDSFLNTTDKKIDKFVKGWDKKLALNFKINNFALNEAKLNTFISKAFNKASRVNSLKINKFDVDAIKLNAAIKRATGRVKVNGKTDSTDNQLATHFDTSPIVKSIAATNTELRSIDRKLSLAIRNISGMLPNTRMSPQTRVLDNREWDRRQVESQRLWWERRNALREDELNRQRNRVRNYPQNRRPDISNSSILGGGGAAGLASRFYMPALALAGGGYGLSSLNRRNQEVISARLTTTAVTEAAGLSGQGPQAFDWLRNQANRIGFNYMDSAQDYNNFLSNALGSGLNLTQSQDVFQGFAEYSRAMGISPQRQKLVLNAAAQMFGKGSVQSEELRRQMAESMPGTMATFAEAYQRMQGTNLTGEQAMQALYDTLKPGKNINTKQLAPFLAEVLRERAAPKLDIAMKTSQAEQGRFQSMLNDQAMIASDAGLESGFARLWRSMTTAMKESTPIVQSLAKAFDEISKYVSFAMLLPQSFKRAFEGRDSWVADMLGEERTKIVKDFWEGLKELGSEIKTTLGFAVDGWKMLFDEFGDELLGFVNGLKNILLYTFKALNSALAGDFKGANNNLGAVRTTLAGGSQADIEMVARGEKQTPSLYETFMGDKSLFQYTPPGMVADKVTGIYQGLWENITSTEAAKAHRQRSIDSYNTSGKAGVLPGINQAIRIQPGAIVINTTATDGATLMREIEPHVQGIFKREQQKAYTELLMMNPVKE